MLSTLRHPWLWQALGWLLVIGATVASLLPRAPMPAVPNGDKFLHMLCYTVLALWFAGLYPRTRYGWIAVALFLMGVAIELAQGAMNIGREADASDIVANSLGIALGLGLALARLGDWVVRVESWTRRS